MGQGHVVLYKIDASAHSLDAGSYVQFQEPPTKVHWQTASREAGLRCDSHVTVLHCTKAAQCHRPVIVADHCCALVIDILLQGHLYITKHYFGFCSNSFLYVTEVRNKFSVLLL